MNHNDVARRPERGPRALPARSLTPRSLAIDAGPFTGTGLRQLSRRLPSRALGRTGEGGQ